MPAIIALNGAGRVSRAICRLALHGRGFRLVGRLERISKRGPTHAQFAPGSAGERIFQTPTATPQAARKLKTPK